MDEKEELFRYAPVKTAVAQMAVPSVISSLVLVVYNMADTYFVGQTHDAYQVAAVSLTNPVFVMFMAVANLLGIGGSALISILLGQQQQEKAKQASSFCAYGSLAFGAVMGGMILLFLDPLLRILGSSSYTWQFSRDYLFYIALGAPMILFGNSFGHAVRGEGAAKASMIGGMIGTVINILLDPLFILTFDMGTAGAAIATVLGNIGSCLYYLYYFLKKSPLLSIHPRYLCRAGAVWKRMIFIGVPAGINSALMSVATVLLNNALVSYGDKPLAAMGIVTKAYADCIYPYGNYKRDSAAFGILLWSRRKKEVFIYYEIQRTADCRLRNCTQSVLCFIQPPGYGGIYSRRRGNCVWNTDAESGFDGRAGSGTFVFVY